MDPNSPSLYTVDATLTIDGQAAHTVRKVCGFRTVEARDGRIYLNGEPIYLRGMLDQGYYPETIYTPPSLELLEEQAQTAKALGFNCLRIHIKVEDPRYYDVADRLGLLVWTEIPNWALLTDAAAKRARQTFEGIVARDGHHPSIIAWTLINENWGTDLTRNPTHRRWLADFYRAAKVLDPTRLVVDNSACCDNAHVASDLEDFHHYRAIPDHAQGWDEWVAGFAGRPDWSWYPDFAHERRADLPLLVSEFGNWGLPDPEEIREGDASPGGSRPASIGAMASSIPTASRAVSLPAGWRTFSPAMPSLPGNRRPIWRAASTTRSAACACTMPLPATS